MSNVVSIDRGPIPDEGRPNPTTVEFLREMLERAESGEVQGVALVALHADRTADWHVAGLIGGFSIVGAAAVLLSYLTSDARP